MEGHLRATVAQKSPRRKIIPQPSYKTSHPDHIRHMKNKEKEIHIDMED
ncbi:Uncharacterized protein APZ42_024360 [Daphnia magna]|uniref:Uncharacterized protein n=1 Tax=Daphnia magna TaxID=35525 RepID=A0A164U3D6_9CRUS|nr:Uncharacterized protein APZ42_024360 [Daphnia magna]